jgi:hypothetical protein
VAVFSLNIDYLSVSESDSGGESSFPESEGHIVALAEMLID